MVSSILDILPLEIILLGLFLAIGLIIGLLLERVIYPYLNKGAKSKRLINFRIILRALQGETILWTIIVSIYALVAYTPTDIVQDQIKDRVYQVLLVILVLSFAWFLGSSSLQLIEYYIRKGSLPKTTIFDNLTRLIIAMLAILAILRIFDISVSPILAALGVGGLAIALALQPTLANLFSGIAILSARQISPGDYVSLASGEEGFVSDVNWRNTTIKALNDSMVIIPNSTLDTLIVTNYSLPITEMNLRIPVGVAYDSDLNQVEQIAIEVARNVLHEVEGGVANFDPFIRFEEFGESSINFMVTLRIKSFADIRLVRHEFIKRLHTRFNMKSINIPFPIRTVYIKEDGSTKQIPVTAKDEFI